MQITAVWPQCSILSNTGMFFFSRIKNPNGHFVQETQRNNHDVKFHPNPLDSYRGEGVLKIVNDDNDGLQVMTKAHMAYDQVS